MEGEQGDVLGSFAQRRDMKWNDANPIVEVLAEALVCDHLAQVLIGGGDNPNIHGRFFRTSQRAQLALLKHAQQLDLHGQTHLPNLVEEKSATMGSLK